MTEESISKKLSELFELHKSGALTKEEYENLKQQLLLENDHGTKEIEHIKQKNRVKKLRKPFPVRKVISIFLKVLGTILFLISVFLIIGYIITAKNTPREELNQYFPAIMVVILFFSAVTTYIGFKLSKGRWAIKADIIAGIILMVIGTIFLLLFVLNIIDSISANNQMFDYNLDTGAAIAAPQSTSLVRTLISSSFVLIISAGLIFIGFKLSKRKITELIADRNQYVNDDAKKQKKGRIAKIAVIAVSLCLIFATIFIVTNRDEVWNESLASQKIMTELNKQPNWASWHHRIVGFKQLSFDQGNVFVAVAISNENATSDYQGEYSIFEFDETNKWKLVNKKIAFTYAYDSDSLAILNKIHKTSLNNYGIEIESGEQAMGRRISITKEIYSFINGEFQLIFSEEKRWQNPVGEWVFELDFVDNSDDYFDLEILDNENSNGRYNTLSIYKFDGSYYKKESR